MISPSARPLLLPPRDATEIPLVVGAVIVCRLVRVAAVCLMRELAHEATESLRRGRAPGR